MTTRAARQFDQWLWDLPQEQLDALELPDLARASAVDQVRMPQITVTTVIVGDDRDALALLVHGVGVEARRLAQWGGLVRAKLNQLEYTVAVRRAGEGIYHLVGSIPFTDSAWRRVDHSWVRAAHPHLSGVILNRADFEALGDLLSEHGAVHVNRMTARVLRDASSYTRGWSAIQPDHREALSETRQGMLVQSLSLTAGSTSVHLRRAAGATFYKGDWRTFVAVVLGRLATAASERRRLLTGRERQPSEPITETLVMALPAHVAAAAETRDQILEAINGLRGGRTAVLHTNPYLHVIATDHLDGSSFDLVITDDHQLTIIPGLRASTGSLARITDAVGDALGMDELRAQAIPDEIPAEDVFAA